MTLLVVGASGLLGANLLLTAMDGGIAVAGATRVHRLRAPATSVVVDLADPGAADALLREVRPRAVINAAAATDVDGCEADPDLAFRVNAELAGAVAGAAAGVGARLIHVSTDAVFPGDRDAPYGEDDPPAPCNVYGRSKLAGERAVIEAHPGALVVRTTIYGWNALPKQSLGEYFLGRLRAGQPAPGFDDAFMTPILVNDLADLLLRLSAMDTSGLLHVTGRTCLSKADFGRRIASAFELDPDLVRPVPLGTAAFRAPRALRPCLYVDRAERLLGALPDVGDGIARFRRLEEAGLPVRLRDLLEDTS